MTARRSLLLATPALLAAPAVWGQARFDDRPIRILVGFPPGGTTDVAARLMAAKMQESLGTPVVVENRAGAHGNIASEHVVRAAPDGHTLLMGTIGGLAINPTLYGNLSFNPQTDLEPVTRVGLIVNVLAVPVSRPWRSVAEVIAAARAEPLTYGSSGSGGAGHLAGEQFNMMLGLRNQHVPYRGGALLVTDIASGQVDMGFTPASGVRPIVDAGRAVMLAVTTRERTPLVPGLPALSEAPGLEGFDMQDWSALMAPRGLQPAIRDALHAAATGALANAEVVAALNGRGIAATPSTPEEAGAFIRSEAEKWLPIVRASGARPT